MKSTILACAILGTAFATAWAQHGPSPYAGQESRAIKSLSAAEIAQLLNGEGMGLAKAAELNGYPGPKHVLELAGPLKLTSTQIASTEAIFKRMNSRAKEIGTQIVEREQALDAQFAGGSVTSGALERSVEQIGALQAELRTIHLDAHLSQLAILTSEQVTQYRRLRGYDSPAGEHTHSH
jgi:Spy/CpxP family protein refolding chaperone